MNSHLFFVAPAPSLFGAPAAPTPAAGGLFGSPAPGTL